MTEMWPAAEALRVHSTACSANLNYRVLRSTIGKKTRGHGASFCSGGGNGGGPHAVACSGSVGASFYGLRREPQL